MLRKPVWDKLAIALVLAASALLCVGTTPPPIDVKISVTVVDPAGKPVLNAGVVMKQQTDAHGRKLKHPLNVELKTDANGAAAIEGFEPGTVVVQVIASGYQTWGRALKMTKADETVNVKLQSPKAQVTIYHP